MFSKTFRAFSAGKQIAWLAVFVALSVAANSYIGIELSATNKITFTYAVCFFAGWLMGPVPGFLVGMLGDAIGFLIKPVDIYWLYGLTLGLYGALTGWVMNAIRFGGKGWLYGKAAIALAAGFVCITCLLNSLVMYLYLYLFVWGGVFQKSFIVYLLGRLSVQSVVYLANVVLCVAILPFAAKWKAVRR